ncbi:IclR family transcriptional regulator [Pseudooceanicola algae]|uniref:HTH-type transcriptional regulator XynR n=1 Tax=Pseudooceanicola algae TaxID=1537215 RepID=A0A418SCS0_9RHOB|nr:IclR family transcriptional regulator [Pseudooceanicola algae]QPM92263.1 HTH-type transcriptional regulator XynR [Pseudooceanicola algae]
MDDDMELPVAQRLEPADITPDRTRVSMEDAQQVPATPGRDVGSDKSGDHTTVQAVDRAINLLEALAEAKQELRLQDIARMTGLKVSTCHHLLNTLLRRGYVAKLDKPRAYFLGPRLTEIASMRGARFDLVRAARPFLEKLAEDTGAVIRLAAFEDTDLTTLCEVSRQGAGRPERSAHASAAHASALGKAILAWLPEPEIARVVADHGLPAFTERTIVSLGELVESLRQIRRHGFAVEDREFRQDEIAIACVIREKAGAVIGSVGVSIPASDYDPVSLQTLQLKVSKAAREISSVCR